ncbi:MAG TPA: hypothetical protein VFP84_14280, partial [Kofleriaceae bacterium]|nr:hypothetical protein [Kofleriaceae bacterium]
NVNARVACLLAVLAVLGAAARARADGDPAALAAALARHAEADVTALRARTSDVASRCTLGAIYARRNDLPRAALFLTDCEHADLPPAIAAAIGQAARDVKHRLDASQLARLDVVSRPEGLAAEVDALPGETVTTPASVWVAPGPHTVRVTRGAQAWTQHVVAAPHANGVVVIETGLDARPAAPRDQTIDLGDDASGGLGEEHTAPPPDIKHPSLMRDKYRGIPEAAAGDAIDDPLAAPVARPGGHGWQLGLRVGAGMFDDGAASARAGLALGVAGRVRPGDFGFVAWRADWSRRGGAVMSDAAIDVLGASLGAGVTVVDHLAVIGQLRGELRLADARGDRAVHRAGLGVATGLELAVPATPITLGVRFEQGVTALVSGARDRAVLGELGVDLF